jgi:glutamate/tyrosine decarboxylase-like PLP-dependent enzyme
MKEKTVLRQKQAIIDMPPDEFRDIGHQLIDNIADLLGNIGKRKVTPYLTPEQARELFGTEEPIPREGEDAKKLVADNYELLSSYSLYNGHPRFWGYITAGAAPIGVLGDLLAAAINPNVGGWKLSPIASEMEIQSVRWIAELLGYPADCGGLLVSGGNMANFVGFLAARKARADWEIRKTGLRSDKGSPFTVYASTEVHTWIEKATDLFGMGTDAIRHIKTDSEQRLDIDDLRRQIEKDLKDNYLPMLVAGSAGTVSTGVVDPLHKIASVCREYGIWFHVDGAYGGFAAAADEVPEDIRGLSKADSVAVDPHKWLYAPLEAGCALVRDPQLLRDAFAYHPPYYHFKKEEGVNFVDYGLQNSRGFRALKVWLVLKQAGREGYRRMINEDIQLSKYMLKLLDDHENFEVFTRNLSIVTFRYVPTDLKSGPKEDYLNDLNDAILFQLEKSGELYISNAVIDGRFLLRACIVNFRTRAGDVEAMPEIIARYGKEVDTALRADMEKSNK